MDAVDALLREIRDGALLESGDVNDGRLYTTPGLQPPAYDQFQDLTHSESAHMQYPTYTQHSRRGSEASGHVEPRLGGQAEPPLDAFGKS